MADSLADRIVESINKDLLGKESVKPGDRLPSMRDLETVYSASRATISQALNILEARGLIYKRQGSGCYVAESARANNLPAQKFIGYVTAGSSDEVSTRIARGVQSACRQHNYHLLYADSEPDYESEQACVRDLVNSGCDALVIKPAVRTKAQAENDYLNTEYKDCPIVLVDMARPSQERSQVVFDNCQAGFDVTNHLIHRGHKRIAFLEFNIHSENLRITTVEERYLGYCRALEAAGLTRYEEDHWMVHQDRLTEYPSTHQIAPFLIGWCDKVDRPSAIVVFQDHMAITLISQAIDMGIEIPEQLEVAGFDNLSIGRAFVPSFTTTSPDFEKSGELAVRLAIEEAVNAQAKAKIYVLPVPVLCRDDDRHAYRELLEGYAR